MADKYKKYKAEGGERSAFADAGIIS